MLQVIDNFISEQSQNEIEKFLIGNTYFPYYYCLDTVESYQEQTLFDDPLVLHQPQFVHILSINSQVCSNAYETIMSKFNFNSLFSSYRVNRIKINLLNPPISASGEHYHVPHFDSKNLHDVTVIYYVNDSDGDTVFFNEKFEGVVPKNLSIKNTVSPKKGRIAVFNSNQFHASRPPLNIDYRCIINMVFTLDNQ